VAGDWIKMTHALPDKPEVLAIAGKVGLNRFDVVGRLFILWRWFDIHTTDGNAAGVTQVTLEECLFGYSPNASFVSAVISVHWLEQTEDGIRVVKFDEHISESAKTRAQTAKRVAKSKARAKDNAEGNGESVTKTVPREEKRREEVKTPKAPKGADVRFEKFWAAYPKKDAKAPARKAFTKLNPDDALLDRMLQALSWQSKREQWVKDGGKFIPLPASWLNAARWEDARASDIVVSGPTGPDPELEKIKAHKGAPIPPEIAARIAALKGKTLQ
jgi:chorismate mutase